MISGGRVAAAFPGGVLEPPPHPASTDKPRLATLTAAMSFLFVRIIS
jgi:hypothetical protein